MPKRTMLMERTGLTAAVTQNVPAIITAPVVPSGAQVGQPVTASTGVWSGNPTSFTFTWTHLGSAAVLGSAQSYTPLQSDVGFQLTCAVVATNAIGSSTPSVSLPTAAVISAGTTAVRVQSMLRILGTSAHGNDYAGLNGATTAQIVADAQYMGVSIWRDNVNIPGLYPALYAAGVTFMGLAFPSGGDTVFADYIAQAHTTAAIGPGALFALEGPNEPGNFGFNGGGGGGDWGPIATWTSGYYAAIKADSILGPSGLNTLVLSASLIGAEVGNWGMQYCTVVPPGPPAGVESAAGTKFADGYNMHLYSMFQGHAQIVDPAGDAINGQITGDLVHTYGSGYSGLSLAAANALPRAQSEGGYQVGTPAPNGTIVDTVTCGKCYLNGLLNMWQHGYLAYCIYTFYEDAPDGGAGFGLFAGPGNPNTPAKYLHNFTAALQDTGANRLTFSPSAVNYTLSGLPSTGMSQLFEKSNGAFELVIWNNVSSWNFAAGTPISPAPVTVTVNFGLSQPTVNVYDPTQQATPIQTFSNVSSVQIALKDYPIIVELPITTGLAPVNTVAPTLSTNTPLTGTPVTMSNGTWTGAGISFTYAWMRAYPTPNVLLFAAASGSTVSAGTIPNFVTENANQTWSITNPDTQTLIFQVDAGDVWSGDVGKGNTFGAPGTACRSYINGAASPFTPGTEIDVSFNLTMTSLTARTEAGGINLAEFHNDDVAFGAATFSTFQISLYPFDTMQISAGNLAASPAPTGAGALFNFVSNGVSLNTYQMYNDPNPIVRGHTYAFRVQVKFGPAGYLNVWRDGVQIIASTGQFGYGAFNNYFQCGIYGNVTAANQVAKYANLLVTPGPLVLGTAAAYTPQAADVGAGLTGSVTATNNFGAATAATLISAPVTAPAIGIPVNTAVPTISPTAPIVNQILTASNGLWTNSPTSYTYQWNTVGAAPATVFSVTLGAAGGVGTGDQGYQFRQVIPSTNLSPLGVVTGQIRVGFGFAAGTAAGTLTAWIGEAATGGNPSDFDGHQVQLTFGGNATATGINGATEIFSDFVNFTFNSSSNLVIAFFMGGTTVNVGVLADAGLHIYYSNTVVDPSATVANGLTVEAAAVAACVAEVDFQGAGSAVIPGATASTFTPQAAQQGSQITVTVIPHNGAGAGAPATSVPTSPVAAAAVPVNTALPSIPGTPTHGVAVTANNGTWTQNPTSFAYQWNHNVGFSISGGKIIGPNGQPWIGRGIKINGVFHTLGSVLGLLMTGPPSTPLTTPLTTLFSGINIVFISYWNPGDMTFAALQPYITALTNAGIVVVLQDNVENEFGLAQPIAPLSGANLTTSANLLASYATFYKNNPYVWFASMNEPELFQPPPSDPYNLTPITQMQVAYYNAVRATGNNSIFVIDAAGNDFNVVQSSFEISSFGAMSNVIWDVHYYAGSGTKTVAQSVADMTTLFNIFGTVSSQNGPIPMCVFEYGNSQDGTDIDPSWQSAVQGVNTSTNVQGTAAYTWDATTGDSLGISATNPAAGLSTYGALVETYISSGPSPPVPPASSGAAIPGATAQSYTPVVADEGIPLTVTVTASNLAGASLPATSAPSAAVT